jgi:flagellar export protein FliJ
MKDGLKESLERLKRLVEIRETYVSVAEAGVKLAENEVRRLEAAENETVGNIQHTQAGIAYLQSATGHDIQNSEKYIKALEIQRELIRQSLEKANTNLEERRGEWTEAMREQKIAAKLQERRLHQWMRETDVAQQKSQDEASIARYIRSRSEN